MANEVATNNPFAQVAKQDTTTTKEMMMSRQAEEVKIAMQAAKMFPRDKFEAVENIKRDCERLTLASQATYSYPRGGENVTGPSIRLAEALAMAWGNMDFGFMELSRANGSSQVMAYAWDLQTNTRVQRVIDVTHKRDTKKGSYKLTDERDIYELIANYAQRRVRACILEVLPGDVVEMAVNICKATVAKGDGRPIQERVTALIETFKKEFGVTKEQIEAYSGRNIGTFGNGDIANLQGVYVALRDKQAKVEDYFPKEEKKAEEVFTGNGKADK